MRKSILKTILLAFGLILIFSFLNLSYEGGILMIGMSLGMWWELYVIKMDNEEEKGG